MQLDWAFLAKSHFRNADGTLNIDSPGANVAQMPALPVGISRDRGPRAEFSLIFRLSFTEEELQRLHVVRAEITERVAGFTGVCLTINVNPAPARDNTPHGWLEQQLFDSRLPIPRLPDGEYTIDFFVDDVLAPIKVPFRIST